jgi:hypothetical protein
MLGCCQTRFHPVNLLGSVQELVHSAVLCSSCEKLASTSNGETLSHGFCQCVDTLVSAAQRQSLSLAQGLFSRLFSGLFFQDFALKTFFKRLFSRL